ncbi:MAG: sodium pump decarboxylase, gamma subunit [Lachnospiraceae bacterium]|nr:sodium pump decarboxylase, gamma subunit [Lachnospiraceae bacterium]MCI9658183.1 sodium pump decarboxylase, gamma subunit [Lachnospiraceae bacterium]
MKQNIRKILAVLVLAMSVMGLTACGNTASTEPEINFDVNYLHSVADFLITNWDEMPAEEIAQYASMDAEDTEALLSRYGLPFTAEAFTTAFAGYEGSAEELGAYVSTDGYEEPVVKGDEITLVTNVTYENRTAKVSIVFNKKSVAQSVTIDPKYSTGEILKKAGMNTILGMGTVFIVLIFISLVIYCFNFIPGNQAPKQEEKPAPKPKAPKKPAARPAAAKEDLVDDKELVAAITAAICAYTGTSSDGFVVRSIRRAESSKWKRA